MELLVKQVEEFHVEEQVMVLLFKYVENKLCCYYFQVEVEVWAWNTKLPPMGRDKDYIFRLLGPFVLV